MFSSAFEIRKAEFSPAKVDELTAEFYLLTYRNQHAHRAPYLVRILHGMPECFGCGKSKVCDHARAVEEWVRL